MKLNIGGIERRTANAFSYAYRLTEVDFSYTVVDTDGNSKV